MPTPTPSNTLIDFVRESVAGVGEPTFRFAGWPHGVSRVWEVSWTADAEPRRVYLKQHTQPQKFLRELHAYRTLLPAVRQLLPSEMRADAAANIAELLAESAPLGALLLAACPGDVAERVALNATDELEVHRRAGAFSRALHTAPHDNDDPLPLQDALRQRLHSWIEQGRDVLTADDRLWAAEHFDAGSWLGTPARVPCHRDYQPRNWIVAGSGAALQWHCIDFEHTRADWWMFDLVKLWDDAWDRRPELEAAFFAGYGRELTVTEEEQLLRTAVFHGVSTTVWGTQHRDRKYEDHGRRVLARLRQLL